MFKLVTKVVLAILKGAVPTGRVEMILEETLRLPVTSRAKLGLLLLMPKKLEVEFQNKLED